MEQDWYSVDQVAERLGLHVRTVRGYIRDGRLKAVRIGKQYRVAPADLDALTGWPAPAPPPRRAEVSAIVELDGIGAAAADRLGTLLAAGARMPRDSAEPVRIQTVYDAPRARLKIVVLGGLAPTTNVLNIIDGVLGAENGMFLDDPKRPTP
ncbi:helix-turn-helix domain-containing protein [Streptomyces sp. NPDC002574]|uniref:helix-turn-helix domain-containing protein n=1 Tax=Streptomyces sp. NPDC002574 TaxID=3364652 RepID=UPI003696FFF9